MAKHLAVVRARHRLKNLKNSRSRRLKNPRLQRRLVLAGISLMTAAWFAVFPVVEAVADHLEVQQAETAYAATLQSVTVSPDVIPTAVERDSYAVTEMSVVQWPYDSPNRSYSDGFGWRIAPIAGASSDHHGVDFTPGGGTPVEAISEGVVSFAGWDTNGKGEAVFIEHVIDGQRVTSVYGHMIAGSITVQAGQSIERGTVLGLVGSTGVSTGNHLHFEIHIDGVFIDPLPWLQQHENAQSWAGLE